MATLGRLLRPNAVTAAELMYGNVVGALGDTVSDPTLRDRKAATFMRLVGALTAAAAGKTHAPRRRGLQPLPPVVCLPFVDVSIKMFAPASQLRPSDEAQRWTALVR
jgi:hypothetical protein